MTKPTDAQIEAEARSRAWDALTDQGKLAWRLDAKAALTAAAEVGDKNLPTCPTCGASEPDWNAAAAFDAQAATEDEALHLRAKKRFQELGWRDRDIEQAKVDTIERCAQELEAAYAECATLNLLHGAARLRALKDE